jgi:hypothetical protein
MSRPGQPSVLCEPATTAWAAGHDTFSYGLPYQSQACQAAEIEQFLRPARSLMPCSIFRVMTTLTSSMGSTSKHALGLA